MMIVNCSFNTMTWSNNSSSFVIDPHEIRTNFSSIYWRILWRLGANYSCFVQGHVTKVYFYSNNAESHYQSPSSLPVYSSVTKIATGSGSLSTGNRTHHANTLSAPDVVKLSQHRASNNKSKFHLHLIALSYIQSLKMYRKILMSNSKYLILNISCQQAFYKSFYICSQPVKNLIQWLCLIINWIIMTL